MPEDGIAAAVTDGPAGARVSVRVIPRAPQDRLDGVRDGRLVLRLTAPPVDDAANEAAVRFVAQIVRVPRARVRLVAGQRNRNKVMEIEGTRAEDVRARLSHG